jgi:asparagine synthase (glutamine-hydrolysing)
MCGIVGMLNNKENLMSKRTLFKHMTKTLSYRGPDETGYYFKKNILFGHKRLVVIDKEHGKQPMIFKNYIMVYNGELYNTEELRNILKEHGYTFEGYGDTEVLLKAYDLYREDVVNHLNGIYALAIYDGSKLFMARDHLGVKPLFYAQKNNYFLFASELKAILRSNIIKPIINKNSLQELLGLGPSKSPGHGIFKDIYELRPGHYLIYKNNKIKIKRYFNVKEERFNDSFEECKEKVKKLVTDSIKRQMISDVGITCFLSGGLDSSIISSICSINLKKENKRLVTYSIDYEGNDDYFIKNDYQVDSDEKYIKLISDKYDTIHEKKTITQEILANYLMESVKAKDLPGMADIDSSLLWFCEEIKKSHTVAISGECADEIFGGYPWFYKEELLKLKFFPWIRNLKERESLLNKKIRRKLKLRKYVRKCYKKTIREMPRCKKDKKKKILFYLNMIWFMTTLLDRKDRMSMRRSLEVRVPFADYRLVKYLWNIPWEYKFYNNQEKGLLREAFKEILPNDVLYRKKNPYPKTHNPKYSLIVSDLLRIKLQNKNSILYKIFDINELNKLIDSKGSSFTTPWFGQLMTGPQLIAYLYQFDIWAEEYNIILKI